MQYRRAFIFKTVLVCALGTLFWREPAFGIQRSPCWTLASGDLNAAFMAVAPEYAEELATALVKELPGLEKIAKMLIESGRLKHELDPAEFGPPQSLDEVMTDLVLHLYKYSDLYNPARIESPGNKGRQFIYIMGSKFLSGVPRRVWNTRKNRTFQSWGDGSEQELPLRDLGVREDQIGNRTDKLEQILDEIEKMNPSDRELFRARYIEGKEPKQLAEDHQFTRQNAHARTARVLYWIKEVVNPPPPPEISYRNLKPEYQAHLADLIQTYGLDAVYQAIRNLPKTDFGRSVLVSIYCYQKTVEKLAKEHGRNPKIIESRRAKALEIVKARLETQVKLGPREVPR